ncbi:WhiB family transcriptional regulator [Actinocorallia aurantiaca]
MSLVPLPVLPLVDLLARLGKQGECRYDPDLHTGPDVFEVEPIADRRARVDAARTVCEGCPVALECLEYALRTNPDHGVWAGYTPRGLAALRAQVRAEVAAEAA